MQTSVQRILTKSLHRRGCPPNCPFSPAGGIQASTYYTVPWFHPSPYPKWHLNRFSNFYTAHGCDHTPSVLWRCWLGGRKGIRPVKKTEWWGAGVVICLEWGADLHMARLMPLTLTVSCFSKIQIGFTFLVPAHPCGPGKRAVKRVCVCVMVVTNR